MKESQPSSDMKSNMAIQDVVLITFTSYINKHCEGGQIDLSFLFTERRKHETQNKI